MFPETCGKALEEIDAMFEDDVPAWRTVHYESRMDQMVRELEAKTADGPTSEKHEHVAMEHSTVEQMA
jgi:hypothetical protein